jgi:AcrR family transcriptional regulator
MPAKGKSKVTDQQRAQIAVGRVFGKSARQIAAETGLSKSAVDHHATSDPVISTLAMRLKHRDEARLEQAWRLAVASILKHLKSKSPDLEIDARRDLMRLLVLGDPPLLRVSATDREPGMYTLEELLQSYRSVQLRGDGKA